MVSPTEVAYLLPYEPSGTEPCLRNLHQHAPELSRTLTFRNQPFGTFQNLPPEPTPFYTGLRNLHQHTLELPGTFQNLPPEPAPATRTGTRRILSGLKTLLAYAVGEKYDAPDQTMWNATNIANWFLRFTTFGSCRRTCLPACSLTEACTPRPRNPSRQESLSRSVPLTFMANISFKLFLRIYLWRLVRTKNNIQNT